MCPSTKNEILKDFKGRVLMQNHLNINYTINIKMHASKII